MFRINPNVQEHWDWSMHLSKSNDEIDDNRKHFENVMSQRQETMCREREEEEEESHCFTFSVRDKEEFTLA